MTSVMRRKRVMLILTYSFNTRDTTSPPNTHRAVTLASFTRYARFTKVTTRFFDSSSGHSFLTTRTHVSHAHWEVRMPVNSLATSTPPSSLTGASSPSSSTSTGSMFDS